MREIIYHVSIDAIFHHTKAVIRVGDMQVFCEADINNKDITSHYSELSGSVLVWVIAAA